MPRPTKAPTFLRRSSRILRERPLVVGTLTGKTDLGRQIQAARAASVDVIEVRLDTLIGVRSRHWTNECPMSRSDPYRILSKIKKESQLPLLLTIRSFKEAGGAVSKNKRLNDKTRLFL